MKRLLVGLVVVVVALVLLGASALLLIDADRFRPQIEAQLSQSLGREVTLGKLGVSIWSGSIDANTIRIAEDPAHGSEAFVTAKSLALGVRLWPLLARREVQITSLTLDNPVVSLRQNSSGDWNFSSLTRGKTNDQQPTGATATAANVSVARFLMKDGRVDVERAGGDTLSYTAVRLDAEQVRSSAAFPFTATARLANSGSLGLEGSFGPWNPADAALTPLDAHVQARTIDLAEAGLVNGSDGIGGVIDSDTRIRSQDGVLQSDGLIEVRDLTLFSAGSAAPRPLRIDYKASYQLTEQSGRINYATISSGAARLNANGTVDNSGQSMRLSLHAAGQQLPVDDVQALLPAFGVILPEQSRLAGGMLELDMRADGTLDSLSISGPVTLENSLLEGFSLGSKLGAALSLAGIDTPRDTMIRRAHTTISIRPSGITFDPLNADIVDLGRISGQGSMAADNSLDFRLRVMLDSSIAAAQSKGGVSGLFGKLLGGAPEDGIGVRVTGTSSKPSFKVDPRAAINMLGAGLSTRNDSNIQNEASDEASQKSDRAEDLLKGFLQDALKSKKDGED